ncbi:MAG: transposase [Chitinophagaceae bacterium]|nr:transposase [Chitinophagaceae bacterium]
MIFAINVSVKQYIIVKAALPYALQVLLKLYLYGYLNKVRSSRKLEGECSCNIELQWLFCKTCSQTIIPLPILESRMPNRFN